MITRIISISAFLLLFTLPVIAQDKTSEPASPGQTARGESGEEKDLATQAQEALRKRNWRKAEELLKGLAAGHPDSWQYRKGLGNAQVGLGEYENALASYDKALELASSPGGTPATPEEAKTLNTVLSQLYAGKGDAYRKLNRNDEAFRMYFTAAPIAPNPAEAYFTLCSNSYRSGEMEHVATACDKAIEADPKKADAYFIKGSVLYGSSHRDKDRRLVVPPGTIEALQKYLELAPEGGYSYDVRYMLKDAGVEMTAPVKPGQKTGP
jgi:tetratricopeptide (TPR) repeat protein